MNCEELDGLIAQEERMIALFESELALMETNKVETGTQNHSEGIVREYCATSNLEKIYDKPDDDQCDPLEWILDSQHIDRNFTDPEHGLKSNLSTDSLSLQAALRNFEFTSANRISTPEPKQYATIDSGKDINKGESFTVISDYEFVGLFLANRSIQATIRLSFELTPHDDMTAILNNTSSQNKPRVKSMKCALASTSLENNEFWLSYIQDQAMLAISKFENQAILQQTTTTNLAAWIDRIDRYLEFDLRQRKLLKYIKDMFKDQNKVDVQSNDKNGKVIIHIQLDLNNKLSLLWGWKWTENKDDVHLLPTTNKKFQQSDLNSLIQLCEHDCSRVIQTILTSLTIKKKARNNNSSHEIISKNITKTLKQSTKRGKNCDGNNLDSFDTSTIKKSSKTNSNTIQDPMEDADDEDSGVGGGDDDSVTTISTIKNQKAEKTIHDNEERKADAHHDSTGAEKSLVRWSPSGRRRSDYEVMRLERIARNQERLERLGLSSPEVNNKKKKVEDHDCLNSASKKKRVVQTSDGERRSSVRLCRRKDELVQLGPPLFHSGTQYLNDDEKDSTKHFNTQTSFNLSTINEQSEPILTENGKNESIQHKRRLNPGTINPKSIPLWDGRKKRFRRPRGQGPEGYAWENRRGLWVLMTNQFKDNFNKDHVREQSDEKNRENEAAFLLSFSAAAAVSTSSLPSRMHSNFVAKLNGVETYPSSTNVESTHSSDDSF